MPSPLAEVAAAFLKLGAISFGGPIAHLGYFRAEFVDKRRWLTDTDYADLVALCQFLPGPASSQVAFALGMRRAGLAGAAAASLCFLLPSAALMIALAYGLASVRGLASAGWLHGLKLAAVVMVTHAVWMMGRNLCTDTPRRVLGIMAAAIILALPGAFMQVGVIALGAISGWLLYRRQPAPAATTDTAPPRPRPNAALFALVLFAALLVLLPLFATANGSKPLATFDSFYRSGALVFGGGHVVLPLLRAELVPDGLIRDDAFLTGYAGAQAVPGPLFSFAAYLGVIIHGGPNAWLGGLWCLLAIFLPAWLLIGGALPFWARLRECAAAQAALKGVNAAVVGILLACLYTPVSTEAITQLQDLAAVIVALALLHFGKAPPVAIVFLLAAAGQWIL